MTPFVRGTLATAMSFGNIALTFSDIFLQRRVRGHWASVPVAATGHCLGKPAREGSCLSDPRPQPFLVEWVVLVDVEVARLLVL